MAKCGDCLHHSMCYLTHSPTSVACCEFADKNKYVEVVRCKDCKHWEQGKDYEPYCNHWGNMMTDTQADDFCSYGERRENE